jgi:hypothetical protein
VKHVLYVFRENTAERDQDRVCGEILAMPNVCAAGRIRPGATNPALRRLWYAEVADDAAANSVLQRLRLRQEIQSAELPAERGLAW